ncbi:hypothetical protein LINPERPRIM_LOCUS23620 [Linum perenne]
MHLANLNVCSSSSIITCMKVGSCEVKEQTKTEACCTPQQPSVKPQKRRSVLTDSKYQSSRHVNLVWLRILRQRLNRRVNHNPPKLNVSNHGV